ncbi:NUDIX hydrolase [Paenibacillus hamazuiensis]|uniref:NUDIX hydrolase n=1 Tax=Paenibacillus hamazuiensis TaxID=2936508 RepID=UPI00200BD549|nr:NUDIX hydrolase [Paenibacillus hamazuiensis]
MNVWSGAAAVCMNGRGEMLMVLQGKPDEEKRWSVPSGGMEPGETFEACCEREVWEETGYRVKVVRFLHEKSGAGSEGRFIFRYFEVKCIGGEAAIQDPDRLIHDIRWQSAERIASLDLCFPEDRDFLLTYISDRSADPQTN